MGTSHCETIHPHPSGAAVAVERLLDVVADVLVLHVRVDVLEEQLVAPVTFDKSFLRKRQSGGAGRRSTSHLRVASSIITHARLIEVVLVPGLLDGGQRDRERALEDAEGDATLPAEGRA